MFILLALGMSESRTCQVITTRPPPQQPDAGTSNLQHHHYMCEEILQHPIKINTTNIS